VILRFGRGMFGRTKADSKLSAVIPQHAPATGELPAAAAQLGKGGTPPVASPVLRPTIPVPPAPSVGAPLFRIRRIEKRKNATLAAGPNKDQEPRPRFVFSIRLSPPEHAAIQEKARIAGMSIAGFMRAVALGSAGPRARRSPPVNVEVLARAVAQLNKAGSNLNQIAHRLNAGQAAGTTETLAALAETRAVLAQIRDAFGRTDRV
jgi:hypothetical protein